MIATTDWLVTRVADVLSVAHECTFSDDLLSPFALLYFLYCGVLRRLFRSHILRNSLILCFLHGLLRQADLFFRDLRLHGLLRQAIL